MGTRPLRQYYDDVTVVVDDDLGSVVEPWVRHRRRLVAALAELPEDQWKTETRCDRWDVRAVVSHLVVVDAFWMMSLRAAQARDTPTTFIRGFDPSTGTDDLVATTLEQPTEAIFGQLESGTDAFVAIVEGFDTEDWSTRAEAPFGHLSAQLILGHAFWDSWLHERDIFEPAGRAPAIESDEVLAATWYSLVMGALQGGLLEDPEPTGPLPEEPIDVVLEFEELPEVPLRVCIDTGVRIARGDRADAIAAGSAIDLIEGATGRRPPSALQALPPDVAAQLGRARQIL
ncbi:MAG: maleylpyruvate isomerase N-terminal domain-containing protein [Acidimicrobiia bacterium]